MSKIQTSTHVAAPVDRVFEAWCDFEKAAERVQGIARIEMLTEGPVRVGTRFRETRVMFGREATEEMEVTALVPNERMTVSAFSCGAEFDSHFHFHPDGSGTRVDLELQTRPVTLWAKITSPLGRLMMGSMKKMIQADMDQLKAVCEQSGSSATA